MYFAVSGEEMDSCVISPLADENLPKLFQTFIEEFKSPIFWWNYEHGNP